MLMIKLNWERRIIVYHSICPKCHSKEILKIKDVFHSSSGGNISHARHIFNEKNCAKITFYICKNCGYVEQYLDKEELTKLL